jgi:hypothetical protein
LVNAARLRGDDRACLVDGLPGDIHDAAERLLADRHGDGAAGVTHRLAADQALGDIHGNGAHGILTEMLRHLEHKPVAAVVGFKRVQDRRESFLRTERQPRRPITCVTRPNCCCIHRLT